MTEKALTRALAALDRGDDAAALEALTKAWRKSRSPRLAELAGILVKRTPSPLAKSLSQLIAPRVATTLARWEALGDVDDPLAASWALDALEQPPFTGSSARPLLEALIDAVARMRDPRLVSRAPSLILVWQARVTPKAACVVLRARLETAVLALAKRPNGALDGAAARLADEIAARFASETKRARTVEELFADVYAHPDDDAPRHVLADALLERGDPRGELIALQLRGDALDEAGRARVAELLKTHGKAWLGPLAPILSWGKGYSQTTFARGFLSAANVILSVGKKAALVLDEPSWATVEELRGHVPPELLQRAPLRGLKRLGRTLMPEVLAALERPLPLEELELLFPFDTSRIPRLFPSLRALTVLCYGREATPELVAQLLRLPVHRIVLKAYFGKSELKSFEKLVVTCRGLLRAPEVAVDELALAPPPELRRPLVELRKR